LGDVARFAFGCVIGDDMVRADICLALFDIGIALGDIGAVGLVPFKRVIRLDCDGKRCGRAAGGLCKCGEQVKIIQLPRPSAILRNILTK
jgi:hypothetical protein